MSTHWKHPPTNKAEACMRALMMTTKMVMRLGEAQLAEHPEFSKLTGPRIGVLFAVQKMGALRMGDIAAKLHVAPRTVTDLIDGLERDGFLRRVPDPKDRRATLIKLTPELEADFGKLETLRREFLTQLFVALTADEQDELIRILEKLRGGAKSRFGFGGPCGPDEEKE